MKKIILTTVFAFIATVTFAQEQQKFQRGERPTPTKVMEKLDINKDGAISKDEAKGPLANHFDKVDTNSDGLVTLEELDAGFKKHAKKGGRKEARKGEGRHNPDKMFEKADQNNDGYISKAEAQGHLNEHFAMVDANGDGLVSKEEAKTAMGKHRGERPSPSKVLEKLDTNKDGFITKDEAQGPLENHFDKLDANQDGKISKIELEKAKEQRTKRRFHGSRK